MNWNDIARETVEDLINVSKLRDVIMDRVNHVDASWGASAAARIFFTRVCFAAHGAVTNLHDETNARAHI